MKSLGRLFLCLAALLVAASVHAQSTAEGKGPPSIREKPSQGVTTPPKKKTSGCLPGKKCFKTPAHLVSGITVKGSGDATPDPRDVAAGAGAVAGNGTGKTATGGTATNTAVAQAGTGAVATNAARSRKESGLENFLGALGIGLLLGGLFG